MELHAHAHRARAPWSAQHGFAVVLRSRPALHSRLHDVPLDLVAVRDLAERGDLRLEHREGLLVLLERLHRHALERDAPAVGDARRRPHLREAALADHPLDVERLGQRFDRAVNADAPLDDELGHLGRTRALAVHCKGWRRTRASEHRHSSSLTAAHCR
eukprot:4847419-Prymnesium_polylepis.3